jgi:N-acetylglutamate synthase-like GNAT family acetyltransferase
MGIGALILNNLIYLAMEQGFREVFLETTATWDDAVSFYLNHGFKITHKDNGDIYFSRKL